MHKRKKKEGVRRRKGSRYWWASYSDASGKRVEKSTGTTNKREAIAVRSKLQTEEWNKKVHGVEPDRSFEQLAVLYLRGTADVKRSNSTDVKRFKPLALYFPEGLLMNTLKVGSIAGYIHHRQNVGVSNKTINKELSVLSSAIKYCNRKLGWNLPNPVVGQRLEEINEEARCFSVDEYRKLLTSAKQAQSSHTRNYLADFIVLGFNTMMRPGEMLNLEWNRVSFDRRTAELRVEDTKGKARRLIPLNDEAMAALLRLRRVADAHFPDTPWVFTHTKPRYFGKQIQRVTKVFTTAVARAEIPHATPHALRHTSITESVHLPNANVVDISKIAGHKNLKTTLGYIHTADERLHDAVADLPKIATI